MQQIRSIIAVIAAALAIAGCAKKEEAPAATTVPAEVPAEAAAPDAAIIESDEDGSQSGGDKVRN